MSSSVHVANRKKDTLILDDGPTQGLYDTTLTTEEKVSISFTESRNKFCLNLYYNGENKYLFVNGAKIHKSKAK